MNLLDMATTLVNDSLEWQRTTPYANDAPLLRLIRLQARRGAGHTAAATKLVSIFEPALLITFGDYYKRYIVRESSCNEHYFPLMKNDVRTIQSRLDSFGLGKDTYQLIVIDPATIVFNNLSSQDKIEVQYRLCCAATVVLQLG